MGVLLWLTSITLADLFSPPLNSFRLKYAHLEADSVLAGLQDRVVESAQWFALGYFGREWASLNATAFEVIAEDEVTVSWITPMDTCKNWKYAYGNDVRGLSYLSLRPCSALTYRDDG